jgi:hypothetical protein
MPMTCGYSSDPYQGMKNLRSEQCDGCPRGDSHLTHMIPITLTKEFVLDCGPQ